MNLKSFYIRAVLVGLLVLSIVVVFISRLVDLQIVHGEEYRSQVQRVSVRTQQVAAARGEILDRYGRPMAVNRMGYDVIIDRAFLPRGEENAVILQLIRLMEEMGEEWIDDFPVTASQPFAFKSGFDNEVQKLKTEVKVHSYASAEDVMYWIIQRYKLEDYPPADARLIAGVRYEMEQRAFSISTPYTFATDIDISSVIVLKERGYELPGVDIKESAVREYPTGEIAPHLIGTVGLLYKEEYEQVKDKGYAMNDVIGKEGVEKAFEEQLRGQNGERQIHLNASGDVIDVVESIEPVPGNTVVLTIDRDLQLLAQQSLEKQIKNLQETAIAGEGREADSGAVAVIHIKTGEVLALATYPSYNLNTYRQEYAQLSQDELLPLWNRALWGEYAPGSCFKPAIAIGGLNEGIITTGSHINCTRVYSFYKDYQPTCLSYHGPINVFNAIQYSCNIFFYDTGRQLGIERMNDYVRQLGLGEPTGIELPETVGHRSTPEYKMQARGESWYPGDDLQTAIGQLYNAYSPLQLANYVATIANRGDRMNLTIVKEIKSYDLEETVLNEEPQVAHHVTAAPEVFDTVIRAMVMTSRTGTARGTFASYPLDVGAKTGTPQTIDYPNSTFVCFAPAEDPEIAIAVVIEKGWHGYTGAPVARDIFDYYFFRSREEAAWQEGVLLE